MIIGEPISRRDALLLCDEILKRAEGERLAIADLEAKSVDLEPEYSAVVDKYFWEEEGIRGI